MGFAVKKKIQNGVICDGKHRKVPLKITAKTVGKIIFGWEGDNEFYGILTPTWNFIMIKLKIMKQYSTALFCINIEYSLRWLGQ